MTLAEKSPSQVLGSLRSLIFCSVMQKTVENADADLYQTLAVGCLGLSLGSYILILILTFYAWSGLKRLPVPSSEIQNVDVDQRGQWSAATYQEVTHITQTISDSRPSTSANSTDGQRKVPLAMDMEDDRREYFER